MNPADENLRRLLHEWRDVPVPEANLVQSVRQEIATRGQSPNWRRKMEEWFGSTERAFRFALGCVVLGSGLGLAGAEWLRSRREREMPERYLRWIDPVAAMDAGAQR